MSIFTPKAIQPDSGFWGQLAHFILRANPPKLGTDVSPSDKTQKPQSKNPSKNPLRHGLVLSLLSGIILGLAHAPVYFFAGLYIATPIILWLVVTAPHKKSAFWRGWFFALGYFTTGLYWIASSMLVDMAFAWMVPFAVLGIPAIYGVGVGIIAVLVHQLQYRIPPAILFACLWVVFEFIRGMGTLTFPWLQVGYISLVSDGLSQGAAYVGVYGLSLLFLVTAGFIAHAPFAETGARKALFSTTFLLPLVLLIWGNSRVASNPTHYTDTVVKIVQPNIAQQDKWNPVKMGHNLRQLLSQSTQPLEATHPLAQQTIDGVIWPETAFTYLAIQHTDLVAQVSNAMPNQAPLITGAPRIPTKNNYDTIYNSVQVFEDGTVQQSYDKMHLVPFGEFIPYKKYLPSFVDAIAKTELTHGEYPHPIRLGDKILRPLVCYEIAFNHTVANIHNENGEDKNGDHEKRPHVLLNLTNDAWFGSTSGPYQHLDIARMRAIEYGIPVLRVANTGISGSIDGMGRLLDHIPLNTQGTLTLFIPDSAPITIFAQHKNNTVKLLMIVLLFLGTIIGCKMRQK